MVDDRKVLVVGNLSEEIVARMRATGMAVVRQEDGINGMQSTLIEHDEFFLDKPVDMDPAERERALSAIYGEWEPDILRLREDHALRYRDIDMRDYAVLGSPRVSPPKNLGRTSGREIQFIDTPKSLSRRKARRMRGKKS